MIDDSPGSFTRTGTFNRVSKIDKKTALLGMTLEFSNEQLPMPAKALVMQ